MQKSELELVIEIIPDAVTILDSSGNITYANRAAEIILGLSRSEIKERTYNAPGWKITTPDGKPFPEEELPFALVMKHKKPVYNIEHAIERPDGKRVILSINAAPLLDEKGNVKSMVASLTDTKERETVELALKESEQRFRELLKEIDLAAVILDTNGRVKFANDYILELAELTWDSVKDRDFFNILLSISPEKEEEFRERIRRGLTLDGVEVRRRRRDGTPIDYSIYAAPLHGPMGRIIGSIAILADVTEPKCSEEQITLLNFALDHVHEAAYLINEDARFLYVNEEVSRVLGYSRDELLGDMGVLDVDAEMTKETWKKHWQELKKRGSLIFEGLHKAKDGSIFPVEINANLFYYHGVDYNLALVRDIAERKETEQALRDSEELNRLTLTNITDAVYLTDDAGSFIYVCSNVDIIFGYSLQEVLSMGNIEHLLGKELLPAALESSQRFTNIEREITDKYGKTHALLVNVIRVTIKGGTRLYACRDITERKQKERFDNALNDINAIISSTLDFDKSMEHSIPLAIETLGVESASVILFEGDKWVIKHRFPKEFIGRQYSNKDAPHLALAFGIKAPVVIDDTYNDPRIDPKVMQKFASRAKLVVPLVVGKELTGLLVFSNREPMIFSIDQIDFATKIATSVYFALENARLFETERDIADTLQEALLTIPKHIRGIEYGYLYRSATEAAKVGGDFFDIIELEYGKVGVIVGDISGKGLKAASLTTVVKSIVRAYAYEETSPAIIMKKTNETVKRAIPAPYFITLFLGIIDIEHGIITYCSAGHPPALIKRRNSVEQLHVLSPIVGAFAAINYVQGDAAINPGDILVLYTDGITEARIDGEFFGEERLTYVIKNLSAVTVGDVPHDIFKKVMDFTGGELTDDVVLLSLALD